MGPWLKVVDNELVSSWPGDNFSPAYSTFISGQYLFVYRVDEGAWYAYQKGIIPEGFVSGARIETGDDIIFTLYENLRGPSPFGALVSRKEDLFQRWSLDFNLVDWADRAGIYNTCGSSYFDKDFQFTLLDNSIKNPPLLFTSGFDGTSFLAEVPLIIGRNQNGDWLGWYPNYDFQPIIVLEDVYDGPYTTALPGGPYIGPYKAGKPLFN